MLILGLWRRRYELVTLQLLRFCAKWFRTTLPTWRQIPKPSPLCPKIAIRAVAAACAGVEDCMTEAIRDLGGLIQRVKASAQALMQLVAGVIRLLHSFVASRIRGVLPVIVLGIGELHQTMRGVVDVSGGDIGLVRHISPPRCDSLPSSGPKATHAAAQDILNPFHMISLLSSPDPASRFPWGLMATYSSLFRCCLPAAARKCTICVINDYFSCMTFRPHNHPKCGTTLLSGVPQQRIIRARTVYPPGSGSSVSACCSRK